MFDFRLILILFLCVCMFFLYREIEKLNNKTSTIEKKITQIMEFKPEHEHIDDINEELENTHPIYYENKVPKVSVMDVDI